MKNQMNQAQQEAVFHGEGPLLVLAGPGSGKTFTITRRILYLIEKEQVPPEEILVITFTKDAALSMQKRFVESSIRSYPVNFGTFHSIFYHILRASGCFGTGRILGESQKKKLISPIMRKYHNYTNILAEDVTGMLSAISYFKNTANRDGALEKLSMDLQKVFFQIYDAYEEVRVQQQALDFDDMVYECEKLLRKDKRQREYWQSRFRHILMDEFQDINPMQYRVIKLLANKPYNIFAVGDDDQVIYGFRGSEPACLQQFVKEFHAKQLLLNVNYRSDRKIVRSSLLVIGENKERFSKKLEASSQQEGSIQLLGFTEREEQYQYLIEVLSKKISETEDGHKKVQRNNDKEDYAILFRTNSFMQGFAARLRREGIAFEMKEGQNSIYEHFMIKDIMAYLRLGAGERDKKLWMQILNKPSRYISREALAGAGSEADIRAIKEYYRQCPTTAKDFGYMDKIRSAIQLLEKQLEYLKKASPYLAVQYVWKMIGYDNYLKAQWMYKDLDKYQELVELFDWLKEDAKHYNSVAEWQAAQQAYWDAINSKEETGYGRKHMTEHDVQRNFEENTGAVIHLMTVHASKGLEFDHVWIPDCNEKVFPHGSMPDKAAVEEERRIFYVAMTRAKKSLELLYLTGTKERPRQPSRFLNPLWLEQKNKEK